MPTLKITVLLIKYTQVLNIMLDSDQYESLWLLSLFIIVHIPVYSNMRSTWLISPQHLDSHSKQYDFNKYLFND